MTVSNARPFPFAVSSRDAVGAALVHVPTPGDHYSPATGSAIMTIIYELSRQHEHSGGRSVVLVSEGTRHDYPVGDCVVVPFALPPTRQQKLVDAGLGLLGFPRAFAGAPYRPACNALPADFRGTIVIWNSPAAVPVFRARHPQARICLYAQNSLFNTYSRLETRRVLATADLIVCCSQYIADELIVKAGSKSFPIYGITNGVDTERFSPAPHLPDGDPVVLFTGRVVPQKGPDLLIKAAQKITSPQRRFRLRIVGSSGFSAAEPLSPYEQELRALAAPIPDVVEFHPFVDRAKVLDEYHAASIFCAPSNWDEPCSLTVPEALACGLPTIASRRGGIPEVGGDAALYFDPPDVDQLAHHLVRLLDDAAERRAWGERARKRAEALAWSRQYERLQSVLLAGSRRVA